MTTGKLTFSVVLNTIQRAGPLRTLLRALEHQSYPHFEVILVVGPTKDNTLDLATEYHGRIRLLRCSTPNLSQSRNIGLLAARGDVVAFVDDDAVPCQRWLEQYARLFEVNPELDAIGGSVWGAHPRFSVLQFQLGIYSALSEQIDVLTSRVDQIVPPGKASHWTGRIPGGNTAIRRQALLDLRGFDEFYVFVAEEADLTLRMVNMGRVVIPVKEALIYHFPATGINRQAFTNKGRWWLRSRSRIYLAIKCGLVSGETTRNIAVRTVRSAGAHLVWYWNLLRNGEFSLIEFLNMSAHELVSGTNALFHGLFMDRKLIPASEIEVARMISEPILKYQNQQSSNQPAVDPVSGYAPSISIPDPPLRICLLSNAYPPTEYGGIARLTHLMAQGLFECGHTVHVITRADRESVTFYDGAYVHQIPNRLERYEHLRNYFNLHATLNYSHNVYDKIRRLVMNDGIQIVDSPFWQYEGLVTLKSEIAPVVVRLVTGLRQITEIHHNQVEEFRLMGDLEQDLLDHAQYLLPNTHATFEAMQKVYDFKSAEGRYTIVPYGIVPAPEDQARPFDPKPADKALTVLYVGRLEKRKGVLDLFEAIPQVVSQIPHIRFILVGADNSTSDGFRLQTGMDYPTYFSNRYAQYQPFVEFKGKVSDETLQSLYRSCDLFIAPSLYESFGLIYLEAMNYAKPVIGCRAGGIPEVVDHGISGLLVEPQAPKALSEAMISMLKSPQKLREMGLAGRELILKRFNYVYMAQNFERIYRQVIHTYSAEVPGASPK